MRAVQRKDVDAPPSLCDGGAGPKELNKCRAHKSGADAAKAFDHSAYKQADVKLALERLFHGKCAYCETRYSSAAPVDIEHYRPKAAVAEAPDHGGYWWIAMAWDNLLPSCIDCNRLRGQQIVSLTSDLAELERSSKPTLTNAGKKDSFPINDSNARLISESLLFEEEGALLLDPCRDRPEDCLDWNFDPKHPLGLMVPKGDAEQMLRGALSIQVYGLNRLKLVQDRCEILRRLEFLGDLIIQLSTTISEIATLPDEHGALRQSMGARLTLLRDKTIQEMKRMAADEAPYAAMARAWMKRFKDQLREPAKEPGKRGS